MIITNASNVRRLFSYFFMLAIIYCNIFTATAAIAADKTSVDNVETTKSLLNWMQKNLTKQATFSSGDLDKFFASRFTIDTNGKIVNATQETYHDYLYKFKSKIVSVHYKMQNIINANDYVIIPFIIDIKNIDNKASQLLRVIAIFKFDENGKIIGSMKI